MSRLLRILTLAVAAGFLVGLVAALDVFRGLPMTSAVLNAYQARLGPHRTFYRTCLSLRHSASLEAAREAMASYRQIADAGYVHGISETAEEHRDRLVFIPGADQPADWCMVYPRGGKVVRVEMSPD